MPHRLNEFLKDHVRGERNFSRVLHSLPDELRESATTSLLRHLPNTADPDMALNNLERLLSLPSSSSLVPQVFGSTGEALERLVQLFAASQFLADTLISYPEMLPRVIFPSGQNPSTAELSAELKQAIKASFDDAGVLRTFRRFRQQQVLRIGANDILRDRPLEDVTRDLSRVADASVEMALQYSLQSFTKKYGPPLTQRGHPARLVALAFGKLGGEELNYSSDIDLMFVYDEDGQTAPRRGEPIPVSEFYSRVITEVIRLLSSHTDRGFAYRVDLRLRPGGQHAALARNLAGTLSYYDAIGRTWERQALIKVRACAGDHSLGREFLAAIEPFVYRRYFSFSEINEIKALKRKMEQRTAQSGATDTDVKTGRGGIRDIEYTVQFLQLLNGGDLHAIRQRNTLLALEALELSGCLTPEETYYLSDAYRFLRKVEHRLQLLFDAQTHKLPTTADELTKLSRRLGYLPKMEEQSSPAPLPQASLPPQRRSLLDEAPQSKFDTRTLLIDPLDQFLQDLHQKTDYNRAILDHLLHTTFKDDSTEAAPETDLLLIQDPDNASVASVLERYRFRDVQTAYQNLVKLAQEDVAFLSHRRCRHFLASIAPQLLKALAETPDPDATLNTLEQVTASLGGKAVLYELFSFNPPSLKLYVELCATSPFLSAILISNPGMIDELLDSLILDQPRTTEELRVELQELLRGANDPEPILQSFQDKELLRIGVRDLLSMDPVRETTASLSDVADNLLNAVFDQVEATILERHGCPSGPQTSGCRYVIMAMGKLGGREISYHSDLDIMLIYEADGHTRRRFSNFEWFTELTQRAVRVLSQAGPLGRLYNIDLRLRPVGRSGSLVVPLHEFRKYFQDPTRCQLWERQSLTRARILRGDDRFSGEVIGAIRQAALGQPWSEQVASEIKQMRDRLEQQARPRSMKRGPGGIVDVEFIVQALQLKYGRYHPDVFRSNVWEALEALHSASLLPKEEFQSLHQGYTFLRTLEGRLRLMTNRAATDLPTNPEEGEKLARQLKFESWPAFEQKWLNTAQENRSLFNRILQREANE
jgi:[glutamine synthetase] adenylyltransferase / [glutamine synthetase]-adenylyl-L-tyrosine phosphorylase